MDTYTDEGGGVDVSVSNCTVTAPFGNVVAAWEVIVVGGGVDTIRTDDGVDEMKEDEEELDELVELQEPKSVLICVAVMGTSTVMGTWTVVTPPVKSISTHLINIRYTEPRFGRSRNKSSKHASACRENGRT